MKNIIITTFTVLAMGLLLTNNPTFASDRVKVYEMAESGILIEFPVETPDKAVTEKKSVMEYIFQTTKKGN
jgi:hypothetical protein